MAQIVQNITLEVSKPNTFQAIIAKQFDSESRFLRVKMVNGSDTINVLSTSTVVINAKRNDGAEQAFEGVVNEDGTVTVPLTYWMLELDGELKCDVSIIDAEGRKLTSTKFIVKVEDASCADPDVSDADKYDILILQGCNIVGSVNGMKGDVTLTVADFGIGDYVVEQGKVGDWEYRKWNSGVAECWGEIKHNVEGGATAGGNFRFSVDYPFAFSAKPKAFIHPLVKAYQIKKAYQLFPNDLNNASHLMVYALLEDTQAISSSDNQVSFYVDVKGRWK